MPIKVAPGDSSKTMAKRAEVFHDELNGHVFNLEMAGVRQVLLEKRL